MKGYPDYSSFAREGYDAEIGALVKITSYNFRYFNREEVSKRYGEYKDKVNGIRARYAIDPIQDKESYKEKTAWSDRAPEVYKGQNAELQTHSYNPQNMFGANIKGVTYAVDTNGHIIRALDDDEVKPYLKAKSQDSGVTALRKMNAEEATIDSYLKEIQELKFRYMNFESNSILWMAATVDGEKIIYINDALQRTVEGIDINPSDFRAIARERYKISLDMLGEMAKRYGKLIKESKNKQNVVRLTESDLNRIIVESIQN